MIFFWFTCLYFPLVIGCIPQGEGKCGSVCGRTAQVQVGVVSCVSPAYVGVRSVGGGGCGNSLCSCCHLQHKGWYIYLVMEAVCTVITSVLHWPCVAAAARGVVSTNRS